MGLRVRHRDERDGQRRRRAARAVAAPQDPRGVDTQRLDPRARGAARVRGPIVGTRVALDRGVLDRGRRGVRAARVRQPRSARRARRGARSHVRALRDALPDSCGWSARVVAVVFHGKERGGLFLLAVLLLFAGLSYLGTTRRTPMLADDRRRPTARSTRRPSRARRRPPPPPRSRARAEATLGSDRPRRSSRRLSRRQLNGAAPQFGRSDGSEPTDCARGCRVPPHHARRVRRLHARRRHRVRSGAVRAGDPARFRAVGARAHPCRLRRRRARRLGTELLVRADPPRRRGRPGRGRELDRGAAVAPAPRRARAG